MAVDPDYADAWRDLKWRRRIMWGILATYIPAMLVIFTAIKKIWPPVDDLFFPIVFCWIAAYLLAVWWTYRFRCPRCHQRFYAARYSNFLARKCLHCGLRRGTTSS